MSRHHGVIKNDPRYHAARAECFERDDYTCVDCGAEDDLQADHLIPLAVIFAHGVTEETIEWAVDPDNMATRCGRCNRRKSDQVSAETRTTWINPKWADAVSF